MTHSLENYLKKRFAQFFFKNDKPTLFTNIECDDGWFKLIYWVCSYIENRNKNSVSPVDLHFVQIKEKFGSLRIYTANADPETSFIINFAEYISYFVCERTGELRNVATVGNSYFKTENISSKESMKGKKVKFVYDDELRKLLCAVEQETMFL